MILEGRHPSLREGKLDLTERTPGPIAGKQGASPPSLLGCTHGGDFLLWASLSYQGLTEVHLPRIQEIKHTEFLRQGLRQPLCIIHNVVMQVSAVGVEHLVLFMCGLDHDRVAVPDCKRATSVTCRFHLATPTRAPQP
jgi:hypothetical protein